MAQGVDINGEDQEIFGQDRGILDLDYEGGEKGVLLAKYNGVYTYTQIYFSKADFRVATRYSNMDFKNYKSGKEEDKMVSLKEFVKTEMYTSWDRIYTCVCVCESVSTCVVVMWLLSILSNGIHIQYINIYTFIYL